MRVRRWAAFLALYLAIGCFLVLGPVRLDQARAAETEEQRLLELINGYRQENDVGPLVPSGTLSTSAGRHSEDMSSHDFFSHSTRESSYYPGGSSPADRAAREGYPTNVYMGENIALGQQTAEEVFEAWRNSPVHDAAMLGEQYTAAGIGHVGSYWTADFGSVADFPSNLGTLKPTAAQLVKPTAEEQTSTPQSAAERTTGEQTTGEQTQPEETPPTEPVITEQPSTTQQPATAQTADGEARTTESVSDPEPVGEAAPRTTTSPQPPTGGIAAEQYARENGLSEALRPPDAELAIGNPNAGTTSQEASTAPTEEGIWGASALQTEAMETVLATREAVPEDLVWQASFAPEQSSGEPAVDRSPVAFDLGASGADIAGITPVATKKSPNMSDTSLLTLVVGGFLLLCGLLVYGTVRQQRDL